MKKHLRISIKHLLSLFAVVLSSTFSLAQQPDKEQVKSFVESKEFTFQARTVLPMTGGSRQLTSEYDVRFLGDSVISYLPYFGRAYTAGYGSDNGGIEFTSTKFDYKAKARKKGGWDITIRPKDAKGVEEMDLTISDDGSASLRVTSTNRQPISFYGVVVHRK
ncbi:MAG: DUF4251 domain-containing protein [Flavisolibacter sp.]